MQWIEKWCDFGLVRKEWVIEGDIVAASVTLTDEGYNCWHPTGQLSFPPDTRESVVLSAVEDAIHAAVKAVLAKLEEKPLPVVVESSPVEVIEGSKGVLGYGYGWLRVKPDRKAPDHWIDAVKLDGGRVAHIHPFTPAQEYHQAIPGVKVGEKIAGVRWFERAKVKA